jgi:U4/U6 small nuclear ribonucleoprotein PRP3
VRVQVFRITDLSDGRHVYKVDVNAVENRLTGACTTTKAGINVVIVEGDVKGIRRFNRLMMHRIDWNPMVHVDAADDAMFEEPNKCYQVWQGTVARPAFEDFKVHKLSSEAEARNLMAERGVVQYWDAAQFFTPTTEAAAT